MQPFDRTAACLAACEKIPDRYIDRGLRGVRDWLERHRVTGETITATTPLTLRELRIFLPLDQLTQTSVWRWINRGAASKRTGRVWRLRAYRHPSQRLFTTLEDFRRFQAKCDPTFIAPLDERESGGRDHLAVCANCDAEARFTVALDVRPQEVLRYLAWSLQEGYGWLCRSCQPRAENAS